MPMKSLFEILTAFAWFTLCVAAAIFLLIAAFIYSGILVFRKSSIGRKIELPRIQFAR